MGKIIRCYSFFFLLLLLPVLFFSCNEFLFLFTPSGYLDQLAQQGISDRIISAVAIEGSEVYGFAEWDDMLYVIAEDRVVEVDGETMTITKEYSYSGDTPEDHSDDGPMDSRRYQWSARNHELADALYLVNSLTGETIIVGDEDIAVVDNKNNGDAMFYTLSWDDFNSPTALKRATWNYQQDTGWLNESTLGIVSQSMPAYPSFPGGYTWDRLAPMNALSFPESTGSTCISTVMFSPTADETGEASGPYFFILWDENYLENNTGYSNSFSLVDVDPEWADWGTDQGNVPSGQRFDIREEASSLFQVLLHVNMSVYLFEVDKFSASSQRLDKFNAGGPAWMYELGEDCIYCLQRENDTQGAVVTKLEWREEK